MEQLQSVTTSGRSGNPPFDDAIYLVVKVDQVILRGDQKQIGLDQGHIEIPRKIAPKCGLSNTIAAINSHNHTGKPSHDRCQGFHDPQVGGENGKQGDA